MFMPNLYLYTIFKIYDYDYKKFNDFDYIIGM